MVDNVALLNLLPIFLGKSLGNRTQANKSVYHSTVVYK